MNEVTNTQARAAQQYAAGLLERLGVPTTVEQIVAVVAIAYLEGGQEQLKWAIELRTAGAA